MAIKLDGKEIDFFAASGSLGFDGRGWWWNRLRFSKDVYPPPGVCVVSKTITLGELSGNRPLPYLKARPIFKNCRLVGWVNALGLPNKGFYPFFHGILPLIDMGKQMFVVSLSGIKEEICFMAHKLNDYDIHAIEINDSCPNTGEDLKEKAKETAKICRALAYCTRHDLILKVSYAQDFVSIARETEGLVKAISFNTVPWNMVFPDKKSPFVRCGGGGVSGKVVRRFYEEMSAKIRCYSKVPTIMPVWDEGDIEANNNIGASAHSFGSVFIATPWWPAQVVKKHLANSKNG